MIKWDGFGKLLKLSFFGLLTSFFTLFVGSSASAGTVQTIGLESNPSSYNSQYALTFLRGGGLLTQYLGQGKGILALNSNVLFWWTPNGKPYFYSPSFQGFFDSYYSCDEITGSISYPTNCSKLGLDDSSIELFKSFFSKVYQNDYAYYNYDNIHGGQGCSYAKEQAQVCFSSHEIGNSLCFAYLGGCHYGCQGGANYCTHVFGGGFTGSQNYSGLTFGNIPYSTIGSAPGQNGYAGNYEGVSEGSTTGNYNNVISGDYTYSTCTNGQILNYAESVGFSKYLCYGGLFNFDLYDSNITYNPIPGTGKSLGQILSYSSAWDTPNDWFIFWNGIYGDSKYNDMWSSYPAVYHTWFDMYNQYNGSDFEFDVIRELCVMYDLNLDMNGVYNGTKFKKTCEFINNGGWDNYGNSGQNIIGTNWNGVGGYSGSYPSDGVSFMQDFFNKAKSKISTDYSSNTSGVLPSYIIVFLLAILLFKFLKH